MILTKSMENTVKEHRINTNFTEEQLNDKSFLKKWVSYLLSIEYDCTVGDLTEEALEEYTELIFG